MGLQSCQQRGPGVPPVQALPGMPGCPPLRSALRSSADRMQRLCVCALTLALALAAFSEASWKPRSQLQDVPSGPGTKRDLEPHWLDQQGPASHHQRQLRFQSPPHVVAGRSCWQPSCVPHPASLGPGLSPGRASFPILTSSPTSDPQTGPRSRGHGWRKKKKHMDGWTSAAAVLRKGTNVPRTELQPQSPPGPTWPPEKPIQIN